MALFKIFKGKAENLPLDIHEGYAYLTTDTGELYVDVDASTRKQISAEKLSRTRDGFTETIEIDDLILMQDHIENKENPHEVSAEQIGADPSGSAAQALIDAKTYVDEKLKTGVLPEGGTDGQVLKRKGSNEVEFGLAEQVEDAISQKPISFQVTGLEGEEFTIEFTEDGEGGFGGVESFNGRSGEVVPQAGDYTAEMVGARANDWMPTANDIGAIPATRTVNGKALSVDITLVASDVGADPSGSSATALESAKSYTDQAIQTAITNMIGGSY